MQINELLETPYDIKIKKIEKGIQYYFKTEDSNFYVIFNPLDEKEYSVSFRKLGMDNSTLQYGKDKNVFKVFATLKEIIQDFLNKNKPEILSWTARGKRAKLYKKFNHPKYKFKSFGNQKYGLVKKNNINEGAKEDLKAQRKVINATMNIKDSLIRMVDTDLFKEKIKEFELSVDIKYTLGQREFKELSPIETGLDKYESPLNNLYIWIGYELPKINGFFAFKDDKFILGLPILRRPDDYELISRINRRREKLENEGKTLPQLIFTKFQILYEVYSEQIKNKLESQKLQSTIFHELVHVYDTYRHKYVMPGNANLSRNQYFNSPEEFNAFYNQITSKIHYIVQLIQKNPRLGFKYAKQIHFDPDSFQNTLNVLVEKEIVEDDVSVEFISKLRKKQYRRFYKRLYSLWKHVSDFIKQSERRFGSINEAIGPHNNRELELMLKKEKPAALLDTSELIYFKDYLNKFKIKKIQVIDGFNGTPRFSFVVTLPEEKWRIQKIESIYNEINETDKMTDEHHIKLGKLLGYSEQDIRDFLESDDA